MDELELESFLTLHNNVPASLPGSQIHPPYRTEQSTFNYRNRPRNPRSCDFCRARKTACIIENGPPCTTCETRGKSCEFNGQRRNRVEGTSLGPGTRMEVGGPVYFDGLIFPSPSISFQDEGCMPNNLQFRPNLIQSTSLCSIPSLLNRLLPLI